MLFHFQTSTLRRFLKSQKAEKIVKIPRQKGLKVAYILTETDLHFHDKTPEDRTSLGPRCHMAHRVLILLRKRCVFAEERQKVGHDVTHARVGAPEIDMRTRVSVRVCVTGEGWT